jgi:hypothetical protein
MNRRTPAHRDDDGGGHRPAWYTSSGTLHLAAFGLGVVAVGTLAYAGGTLKITATGITLAVNARS